MNILAVNAVRGPRRVRLSTRYYGKSRRKHLPRISRRTFVRTALLLLLAWGLYAASCGILNALGRSVFFQITAIDIHGCRHTDQNLILKLSGVDIHTNLVAMSAEEIKRKIEAHEWIERATLSRHWPNQLTVTIKERTPVALLNRSDGLYYLDKDGNIFAAVGASEDVDFPVITGEIAGDASSASAVVSSPAMQEALRLLRYAGSGNSVLPKQNISEINVTEHGDMILYLADRVFPIYLGKDDISIKYSRLVKVLKKLYKKREFLNTAYIRLDYSQDEVLVGMTKSGGNTRG